MKQMLRRLGWLPVLMLMALALTVGVGAENATATVKVTRGGEYGTVTCDSIQCGKPTTFTVNPKESGTYKYYLAQVQIINGNTSAGIIDPSSSRYIYKDFRESNKFEFTFFASGDYSMRFMFMTTGEPPYSTYSIDIQISIQDPEHPTIEAIADGVAAQCDSECTTEFEKALWLHDWVIDHCVYDETYTYWNAEGVLARSTGTCESYHSAYAMLLNRAGLESKRVAGNGHAWTAVKIDGKWCQVDTTWDDSTYLAEGYDNTHLYFGLNDALTTLAHSQHTVDASVLCDTLDNNYFIRTGKIRDISGVFDSGIQQNLAAGNLNFSLAMPDAARNVVSYTRTIYYTLAAYDLSSRSWTVGNDTYTLTASYQPGADSNSTSNDLGSMVFKATKPGSGTQPVTPVEPTQPESPTQPDPKPSQPETPAEPSPSPSQPETPSSPSPTPSTPTDNGPLNRTDHIAYVKGFPDGTVRPEDKVTRAQTATMLYRLLTAQRRDEVFTGANSFTDVPASSWFNKAVSSMAKGGYITGYPGGYFDPDRNITRAEFVTMVARFGTTGSASASFTDVSQQHWAYQYIAAASEKGWVTGYEDGSFHPDQNITRAEAMAILNRVLGRGISSGIQLCPISGWSDNTPGSWYYYEVLEATNGHLYTGSRPNENWSALTEQTNYDAAKYENP